ncbi:CaiB/BaiF CoA transferase family protein [Nocardia rhizosphaerihabitans]|uniref:CoA transferase n=1 Tax=Nocardia rhizosphaerihabitans TaxID=1691570 RepID=A0ABQ2KEG2_9NOCA|nr:CoA transferase [Nocardia rhizosphaerihabitans]GGN78716.1 CoA transferase [Nocardia rhizosphaerihabitans]
MADITQGDPAPLSGIKVLDLSHMLAGPYATMTLADLGAEVIKVEPLAGDMIRRAGPDITDEDTYGGYFASVNRNKKCISLDLRSDMGREVLLRLVAQCDVLVENFRVGVMDRLGLSYESLREINPRLVYGCIRGFGDPRTGEGELTDWPAYDVVAQAMGGVMQVTGEAAGPPMKSGPGLGDIFPAALLTSGVLAGVVRAQRTGQGSFVDVSMYDAMVSLCERIVYQYSVDGSVAHRVGNAHPFFEPFGLYPAMDGWFALAAPTDEIWRLLVTLIGRDDLGSDSRLSSGSGRSAHRDEVRTAIEAWSRTRTLQEIRARLGGRVPFGPVQDARQIVEDGHLARRDMLWTVAHPPTGAPLTLAGQPIHFHGVARSQVRPAPALGEHTDEVLAELDFSDEEVARWRREGILR